MRAICPVFLAIGEPKIVTGMALNALPCKLKADMPTPKLTNEIISAAIRGFEEQKRLIDNQIAELRAIETGAAGTAAAPQPAKQGRRKISAAGRKAIAEAQRKRWAASKAASAGTSPEPAAKPKRRLSEAGRKAIIAATKRRWALQRAAAAKAAKTE